VQSEERGPSAPEFPAGFADLPARRLAASENGQPRPGVHPTEAVVCYPNDEDLSSGTPAFGKRTRKPNSVLCGHSSRRSVAACAHQRPTRRFRALHAAALTRCACWNPLNAPGRHVAPSGSGRPLPSLFGLAPCGVYPATGITAGAVRSYRTFSPLPLRGAALWSCCVQSQRGATQRRYVFCGTSRPRALTPASRTLSGTLPCGVRTFLSRQPMLAQRFPAATARSSCQALVYRDSCHTSAPLPCSAQPAEKDAGLTRLI